MGDRERVASARALARALDQRVHELDAQRPGPLRHGALATALVLAGELAQGVADAERGRAGADDGGPGERAALLAVGALARALWRSWRCGGVAPAPRDAAGALRHARLPEDVRVRRAEGFALYAVYPECHAAAGQVLAGRGPAVVGIRSIGTVLAAMVAAGAGTRRALATVRPGGHPFRREVCIGPHLARRLLRSGDLALADEGPGLSGSSFAGLAEALLRLGAGERDLHLFPSHAHPPGPEASADGRALFLRLRRHHVPFEAVFLSEHPLSLARLAEDVVGPADAAPEDLSAGAWRRRLGPPAGWPPSQGWRERRKYLVAAGGRRWLARFCGLGDAGERLHARARALARAGLIPEPAALRHGFLFEPFEDRAVSLDRAGLPRHRLLEAVERHLAFVASRFPAAPGDGATAADLAAVAVENASELLGPGAARDLAALARAAVPDLEREGRPVAIDGKLQRWEWLVLPGGRILKADALDHHADHALVGCQDALWDVAGAAVELELGADETERLAAAVRAAAPGAPPRTLRFLRAAYAAFEAGRWTLAARDGGLEPDERRRRNREADRLRDALRHALSGDVQIVQHGRSVWERRGEEARSSLPAPDGHARRV
jgi:hypothetical protein